MSVHFRLARPGLVDYSPGSQGTSLHCVSWPSGETRIGQKGASRGVILATLASEVHT